MRFSFLIIDDNAITVKETLELFENFPNYFCAGIVKDNQTAINQIIKVKPQLVLIRIPIKSNDGNLSFTTITELFQYVDTMPYFIGLASSPDYALEASNVKTKNFRLILGAKDLVLFGDIVPAVILIFLFLKKEQKGFSLPSGLRRNMFFNLLKKAYI